MKKIEPAKIPSDEKLTTDIHDFWTENVNAERVFGKKVTESDRGTREYFNDLVEQRYRSHRHLMPWINSLVPGKSVLEIGSGVGLDTFSMAQHGMHVTAIDLTEVAIETVKKRFEANDLKGEFKVADACNLPFENSTFDYVYSFGVLHHTSDTEKSIREAYRVLKPAGEARIMLYNRHSINELVHRVTGIPFEEKNKKCPVVRRFSAKEVMEMFSDFSSVEISKEYVYGEGYGKIFHMTPLVIYDVLSKFLGWHLMIRAVK